MNTRRLTAIEPDHRVRLPSDWAESLGLTDVAALDAMLLVYSLLHGHSASSESS